MTLSPSHSQTIAVIGAGPLGRNLALRSARAGFSTILEDLLPSKLRSVHEQSAAAESLPLRYAGTIEEAVRTASLILDSVPDELESKLEIFSLLDRMAPPGAIFLSPMRALSIADLASCTYRPELCLALELEPKFSSDPSVTTPVTLVTTRHTQPHTAQAVREFLEALGCSVSLRTDMGEPPHEALPRPEAAR